MKTRCTVSATLCSSAAATQPVGIPSATSSACEGPESTATGQVPFVSSRRISDMRRCVSCSTPFVSETRIVPPLMYGAAALATPRRAKDGAAKTSSSSFFKRSRSFVIVICWGIATFFSKGFSRFSESVFAFSALCDHKVTS